MEAFPLTKLCYIFNLEADGIQVCNTVIPRSMEDVERIPISHIPNLQEFNLRRGDRVRFRVFFQDEGGPLYEIKGIVSRDNLLAHTPSEYLHNLSIVISRANNVDLNLLKEIILQILGIKVTLGEDDAQPSRVLFIDFIDVDDTIRGVCPFMALYWWEDAERIKYPQRIAVPMVSEDTMEFLKRAYPTRVGDELILRTRVLALRIIHALLHWVGYQEHYEWQTFQFDRLAEVLRFGDPSLLQPEKLPTICILDWELLHLFALEGMHRAVPYDELMCEKCRTEPIGLVGLSFLELEAENIIPTGARKLFETTKEQKFRIVYYVLEFDGEKYRLGIRPFRSQEKFSLSKEIDPWKARSMVNDKDLILKKSDLSASEGLMPGDKIILELTCLETTFYGIASNITKNYAWKAIVKEVVRRGVGIFNSLDEISSSFHILLRAPSGVDDWILHEIKEIVESVTGWKLDVERGSDEAFENYARKFDDFIKNALDSVNIAEFRATCRDLIELNASLGPQDIELEDKIIVIAYYLPYNLPIDVLGRFSVLGEARERVYAIFTPSIERLTIFGEVCNGCVYQSHTSETCPPLLLTSLTVIHEIVHILYGCNDHRDCKLCHLSQPEYEAIRKYFCEPCIRSKENHPKKKCVMTYECHACLGLHLKSLHLADILCEECKARCVPISEVFLQRIPLLNFLIYYEKVKPQPSDHRIISSNFL